MNVEDFMFKVAGRLKNKADEAGKTARMLTESDTKASKLFGMMMYLKANILYEVTLAILDTIEEMKK